MIDLLFALEHSPLMSIQSPGIIDVSSDSGEEFVVHPDNLPNLDGRFRVNGPISDMMTAFVGAASATSIALEADDPVVTKIIDTAGPKSNAKSWTLLKNTTSAENRRQPFVNTELEDSPMSLWEPSRPMHVPLENYGRATARILPTPMNDNHRTTTININIPTYPTNFAVNISAFQIQQPVDLGHQRVHRKPNESQTIMVNHKSAFTSNRNNMPMYNECPLMIQISPHEGSSHIPHLNGGPNPVSLPDFPFQVDHITNLLRLPLYDRQMYRLFPTVMPNVAGFCE